MSDAISFAAVEFLNRNSVRYLSGENSRQYAAIILSKVKKDLVRSFFFYTDNQNIAYFNTVDETDRWVNYEKRLFGQQGYRSIPKERIPMVTKVINRRTEEEFESIKHAMLLYQIHYVR